MMQCYFKLKKLKGKQFCKALIICDADNTVRMILYKVCQCEYFSYHKATLLICDWSKWNWIV